MLSCFIGNLRLRLKQFLTLRHENTSIWYRIKDFQDSRVLVCTPNKVISQRWYLDTCCCTTNIVVHSSLVYTLACAQDEILPTFICCTSTSIRFSYFPPSQGKFSSFTLIMEVIKNLSYSTIHGILLQSARVWFFHVWRAVWKD